MNAAEPLVSIVVVVHNDRERLARAVRSALGQALERLEVIVVDDGSTDGTAEVARALAVADPRVRVHCRPTCSGRPGVPRNEGLDLARGRYVLCLDGDDELEPDSLHLLVQEAEATGVDAVFGRTTRVNPTRGTSTEWMPWLFEPTGLTTIAASPHLVGDTILVDKLFRREILGELRFPEDILYEDVVLTAGLYTRLDRVSVTAIPLYRWYVRAQANDRSITNSRREVGNLQDRLEANRRAARLLDEAGRQDLRHAKDRKVVDHDLPLLLRDLVERGPEIQAEVLGHLQPFVSSLLPSVLSSTEQPGALMLAALAAGDRDEVLAAAALAYRRHLVRPLARGPEGYRWPGVSGAAGDVTALVAPLEKDGVVIHHEVRHLSARGAVLHLEVRSMAMVGELPADLEFGVVVRDRRAKKKVSTATARTVHVDPGGRVTWQALVKLGHELRETELLGELDVRVTTKVPGASRTRWVLAVPEAVVAGVELRAGRLGRRCRAMAYQTALGNLSLRRTR